MKPKISVEETRTIAILGTVSNTGIAEGNVCLALTSRSFIFHSR